MKGMEELYTQLLQIEGVEVRREEPMSRHTTFRVGGPATLMALPTTQEGLVETARRAAAFGITPAYVGNGSNLLVDDQGVDTLVIKLCPQFAHCQVEGEVLTAQSGIRLSHLAHTAAQHGLTGLEFAHGIPGSLGGGVVMNAGAYGGELKDVIVSVGALTPQGEVVEYTNQECQFTYRHSRFSHSGEVVLWANIRLQAGDKETIFATMEELAQRRREKQPLEYPSAGSTFKRPQGHFAAALIEQCGLKGFRVGGAQVSTKHSGFVVNMGGATCQDIRTLMEQVQQRVLQETGVSLEPEVKYMGKGV